jgi:hypothetical protein
MPITPLPPSNTKRYFIEQNVAGEVHYIQVRCGPGVTDAGALARFQTDFALLTSQMHDDVSFTNLYVADLGSDIRNPVAGWTPIDGASGSNMPVELHPKTLCLRGRSSTGRKVRMFLWGMDPALTEEWKYVPPVPSGLNSFRIAVTGNGNFYITIDGTPATYRADMTIGINDHWVSNERQ